MAVTVLLLQVPSLDGPGHLPQWDSPAATVLRAFPTGSRFCLLGSGHQDSEACGHRNENTAQGLTEFRGVGGLLAQAPLSRVAVPFPVGDSAGQGDLHIEKAGPLTNGWRFQAAHEVRERGGPLGAQGPCCGAEGCAQSPRGGPARLLAWSTTLPRQPGGRGAPSNHRRGLRPTAAGWHELRSGRGYRWCRLRRAHGPSRASVCRPISEAETAGGQAGCGRLRREG